MLTQKRNKKHNMWGMSQRPLSPSITTSGFEAQHDKFFNFSSNRIKDLPSGFISPFDSVTKQCY